ncbi:response regulator [Pleionea sediminis]|uniref:response regulator n=1 Tax=Pleionea sediminis TaxID=2569479 RepID=UPI00118482D2|nr:response regulator [Pleionea sediminis]
MCDILVVDDDPMVRMAHERMLSDNFDVESLGTGKEVIKYLESNHPDVILLDVGLPDIDGFEVCKQLTDKEIHHETSIIFVSGHTDLATRIKAFDSGADDFIGKPLNPNELVSKVNVLKERKKNMLNMAKELKSAHQTALTAMSTSSQLGRVMQFVERSFSISSVEQLITVTFELLQSMGLNAVISTEIENEAQFFSPEGQIKPIEQELLEILRSKGRFYDYQHRTQVNYALVSLLIKNMPIDNPDEYGRVKDLLPAIVGCLNSRLSEIGAQENILAQAQDLIGAFDVIQSTMTTLTQSLGSNQKSATDRLHKMVDELQVFIQRLGLEEDQEVRVIQYVDDSVEESLALLDAGEKIFSSFQEILANLQQTVEKQNKIVEKIMAEKKDVVNRADVSEGSDVELF